jgi:predicted transcriptional regulator
MDPSELEARFSMEDSLAYLDSIFTEPTDEDLGRIEKVREILAQIPPREADFVDLYFFKKLRQTDIAEIFGVSQPTVSYRLTRATARIRFLLEIPTIGRDDLEKTLSEILSDPLDISIMLFMWETTCQSEVAKRLGVSQGLVRHRFLRSLRRMEGIPRLECFVVLFTYIADNPNILREVQRPAWNEKVSYCLR